jgi:hypothetical protein
MALLPMPLALGVVALSVVAHVALYRFLSFAFGRGLEDKRELACRAVSCFHAAAVLVMGATAIRGHDTALGRYSLSTSVGYFIHDLFVIIELDTQPKFPLLLHHVLSGASCSLIVFALPNAVWYACLLQCTEGTVPIQFIVWLLEDELGTRYTLARWIQLLAWLLMRIALVIAFCSVVLRDWASHDTPSKVLGIVMGPGLLLFNFAGLVKVILPGCPWTARSGKKRE